MSEDVNPYAPPGDVPNRSDRSPTSDNRSGFVSASGWREAAIHDYLANKTFARLYEKYVKTVCIDPLVRKPEAEL